MSLHLVHYPPSMQAHLANHILLVMVMPQHPLPLEMFTWVGWIPMVICISWIKVIIEFVKLIPVVLFVPFAALMDKDKQVIAVTQGRQLGHLLQVRLAYAVIH